MSKFGVGLRVLKLAATELQEAAAMMNVATLKVSFNTGGSSGAYLHLQKRSAAFVSLRWLVCVIEWDTEQRLFFAFMTEQAPSTVAELRILYMLAPAGRENRAGRQAGRQAASKQINKQASKQADGDRPRWTATDGDRQRQTMGETDTWMEG